MELKTAEMQLEFLKDLKNTGVIQNDMSYNQRKRDLEEVIRRLSRAQAMRTSLETSIYKCGGDVKHIMRQVDEGMTVLELFEGLGPNHVRFTHSPPMKKKEYYGPGGIGEAYGNAREIDLMEGNRG
ncbi:hypothetical protein VPHD69_0097 [Vibrio phage D69]